MHIVRLLFALLILAVIAVLGVAGVTIWYFGRDLPDYKQLANYQPPIVSRVYAGDGRLLAEYATEKRIFVPVKAMSHLLTNAFIAAEDKDFYSHPGVNFLSMARAGLTDLARIRENRRPLGASTITQQVAKNFLLGNEVSLKRKIKEALVALRMEQILSKDRILELYLNEIYLGRGSYGVAAASLTYFNKPLDQLDIAEVAFLAALPKAPSSYNPDRFPQAAKERRDWVIDRMADDGFIKPSQAAQAKMEPLTVVKRSVSDTVRAPYFAEEVRRTLVARYGEKALYQGGLTVRTSLDAKLQDLANKALRDGLIAYDRRHGWRGPVQRIGLGGDWRKRLAAVPVVPGADAEDWKLAYVLRIEPSGAQIGFADDRSGSIPLSEMKWARKELDRDRGVGPMPRRAGDVVATGDVILVGATGRPNEYALEQIPEVSGALVVIDPHTGRVLALAGGFSYEISQFDRATQAYRQMGSAIKPFVYIAAFQHGFTPSSRMMDEPVEIDQGPNLPKWTPSNYTHRFYGLLTLRVGVEESRNLVTARLGETIGLDAVAHSIESFGIMDKMPHVYSMVLGAGETTPLKLTTAYAMLDNGGKQISPTLIDRVQDRNGTTIYRADERKCEGCENIAYSGQAPPELPDTRKQIVDPQSDYQIVSVLQGVVQHGTGHSIASLNRPIAGKTGTTNDSKDSWFVGFTPDLTAGVFVGFDNPRSLGGHETGATVAAPIFKQFMGDALADTPAIPFRIPPGLMLVRVDHATGELPYPGDKNVILEAFKPGTQPTVESGSAGDMLAHMSDDEDAASLAPASADEEMAPPSTASAAVQPENGQPVPVQIVPREQAAPSTGTGGLY
ncbi:MAG TPA: penicillin-binding protein 1A [Stellaceae bacterium]|nr:penicillin-binding protein 1A [Stellaceae bacterium]